MTANDDQQSGSTPAWLPTYAGHICCTTEPGCTCADHAVALRERDQLRADLKRVTEQRDALRVAFIYHRTATHDAAPTFCKTCRESDAALADDRQGPVL